MTICISLNFEEIDEDIDHLSEIQSLVKIRPEYTSRFLLTTVY